MPLEAICDHRLTCSGGEAPQCYKDQVIPHTTFREASAEACRQGWYFGSNVPGPWITGDYCPECWPLIRERRERMEAEIAERRQKYLLNVNQVQVGTAPPTGEVSHGSQ